MLAVIFGETELIMKTAKRGMVGVGFESCACAEGAASGSAGTREYNNLDLHLRELVCQPTHPYYPLLWGGCIIS